MKIKEKHINIFLFLLAMPALYFFAFEALKASGNWHTKYNVLGFLFIAGSMPWSQPFVNIESMLWLKEWLGLDAYTWVLKIVVCFGFALNGLMLFVVFTWCLAKSKKIKNKAFSN